MLKRNHWRSESSTSIPHATWRSKIANLSNCGCFNCPTPSCLEGVNCIRSLSSAAAVHAESCDWSFRMSCSQIVLPGCDLPPRQFCRFDRAPTYATSDFSRSRRYGFSAYRSSYLHRTHRAAERRALGDRRVACQGPASFRRSHLIDPIQSK